MQCLELVIPPLPQFVTVGKAGWMPGEQHFERCFPLYDMVFVSSGELYMTEDGVPYELGGGELLVLTPGKVHFGHRPSAVPTELYWLHFIHAEPVRLLDSENISWTERLRPSTTRDLEKPAHTMYLPKRASLDFKRFRPLLDRMVHVHHMLTVEHCLEAHSLMMQIFAALQYSVCRQLSPQISSISSKVADYLRRTMRQPFHAEELERELHFQYDYLSWCFKKATGMTPVKYLQHLRVEEAKALLQGTDWPLAQVGEAVGIGDVNYFVRLFGELAGVTPNVYRKSRRGYL